MGSAMHKAGAAAPQAAGPESEDGEAGHRDWGAGLPSALLMQVFSNLLTFSTAHPSFLPMKAAAVATLRQVCKQWAEVVDDTPIGVCLPARLSPSACRFVCGVTLRGVEFHDPEHSHPAVVRLLSNPRLLERSGRTIQSIIDAPFDGVWQPSNFPNINQLVVWRYGRASATWDVRCIQQCEQLSYLVLACGFKSMAHLEAWPPTCKHLVWTSPSDTHSSRLTVPTLPRHMSLHWMSLRAYAVRFQDPASLLGRVSELTIHAAFIFVRIPAAWAPAESRSARRRLLNARARQGGTGAGAGAAASATRGPDDDAWAEEGLHLLASRFVEEHTMMSLRLKFARMLISQPVDVGVGGSSIANGVEDEGRCMDASTSAMDTSDEAEDAAAGDDDRGAPARPRVCRSCGRPRMEGDGGDGGDDDGASTDSSSQDDELMYDEVTPEQVQGAFRLAIHRYAEAVAARGHGLAAGSAADHTGPPPPPAGCLADSCTCAGSASSLPAFVVPQLEPGKVHPGQERELTISRKHADPREPARLKLDGPDARPGMTLAEQTPLLVTSRRPIQALAFAAWPYQPAHADRLLATAGVHGSEGEGCPPTGREAVEHSRLLAAAAAAQAGLLADTRVIESSATQLRKVNNLVAGPQTSGDVLRALLAPYVQLTKVSVVLAPGLEGFDTPVFPVSVVKVGLQAAGQGLRFNAGLVSNLTEMWRLTLAGFERLDLSALPAVRPGFILKIVDVDPGRSDPLGKPGTDVLMPKGHIVDLNVQIGTDRSVEEAGLPVVRVHLSAWAPLCRDLHIRSPPGVELYTSARNVTDMFKQLTSAGISQFTVCLAMDPNGTIAAGPTAPMAPDGRRHPVFSFLMTNGARFHGMSVAMLVREGMVHGWGLEVMDAGAVEHEPGLLYITFYRTDLEPPISSDGNASGDAAVGGGGEEDGADVAGGPGPSGGPGAASAGVAHSNANGMEALD